MLDIVLFVWMRTCSNPPDINRFRMNTRNLNNTYSAEFPFLGQSFEDWPKQFEFVNFLKSAASLKLGIVRLFQR